MGSFLASSGRVILMTGKVNISFEDIEANFAPPIKETGKYGTLDLAEPLDACSPLTNKIISNTNKWRHHFALIVRGGCSFEDKVRIAQDAGFKAAIVYNNDGSNLVAMSGNSATIKIHAVFISRASGETLAKYAGANDVQLWLSPVDENSAWSIMLMSFISLLAMSAVLATCFFVRRNRIGRERPRFPRVREFHGLSSRLVQAMPSLIFTAAIEDNCTSQTCAICLEDYSVGERLRILPCCHKFHASCVDTWLTSWRTFCPVCKQDVRATPGGPPASESTPLLSSASSYSILSSSSRSSFASTSALPYDSLAPSSQGSVDLSQRSDQAYFLSVNSLGHDSSNQPRGYLSPPYVPSVGSTSRQPGHLDYCESTGSFSPFASTNSLPGC
ncbi:Receptor homology region- transmembrane domain-and RING domain-containing protein 2 [Striga hermonthica]|uniref:Receptor homology region- transmembrane domain-and RING domain-containing protein 2 n=1 Tax=Striga hermonthica TaxID=68872 RepID=A0A9N7R7C0_STRHE|nr:Receptor homology region- transmembrane domain-and RING domain-containing protein 2 [Striga hermonthica]